MRESWTLDPTVAFLNHGSYGACPARVLELQATLRARMEREPVLFLARELEPLVDGARAAIAAFVGADPDDVVAVRNATAGVNAVLRSLAFEPGDEILVTSHGYNACANAARFVAERAGARVVVAELPFPIASPSAVTDAVLGAVSARTRLVLIDHVTSPTGLVLPIEELVPTLRERGIETLVDGAHAPGMLALDLDALGAGYYVGNLHKWVCAPKGAGFLFVRRELQGSVRPTVISHGANSPRTDRSRFQLEFGGCGTDDPTALLCVPEALRVVGGLVPGGWDEVRRRNRALALRARDVLCAALAIEPPAPDAMIGSLAAVPLPGAVASTAPGAADPLNAELFREERIEVPVYGWPGIGRLVRVSAQLYNEEREYERLAQALARKLA